MSQANSGHTDQKTHDTHTHTSKRTTLSAPHTMPAKPACHTQTQDTQTGLADLNRADFNH